MIKIIIGLISLIYTSIMIILYFIGHYNSNWIVNLFWSIDNPIGIFLIYTIFFILFVIPFGIFIYLLITWHVYYLWCETTMIKCPVRITSQNLSQRNMTPDSCCQKCRKTLRKICRLFWGFIQGVGTYYPCYYMIFFGKRAKDYIDNHSEWHPERLHNGIVICPSRGSAESYYSYGPDDLTEYFFTNHIPYKVYACNTIDDFKSLVKNDQIGVLWLFGHGDIGSFRVTNKDVVNYYEFETDEYQNHKKIAVYQLHCNLKNTESPNPLSKILVDGWDFQEKGKHYPWTIKAYIRYIISHHTLFPGIWESVN